MSTQTTMQFCETAVSSVSEILGRLRDADAPDSHFPHERATIYRRHMVVSSHYEQGLQVLDQPASSIFSNDSLPAQALWPSASCAGVHTSLLALCVRSSQQQLDGKNIMDGLIQPWRDAVTSELVHPSLYIEQASTMAGDWALWKWVS